MKLIFLLIFVFLLYACGDWEEYEHIQKNVPKRLSEVKKLVINGEVHLFDLKEFENYTHLEFTHGAILITDGKDIAFNLQELKSDGGIIMTSKDGATALDDNAGRDGGNILIKTAKAIGDLHVILRGENAGKRTDAPESIGESGRGSHGANGSPGHTACFDGFHKGGGHYEHLLGRRICHCAQKPGNGDHGGSGAKGKTGYKGYDGGDSGNIEIIINDGREFTLTYDRISGIGGLGSRGGTGGPGGYGGKPGAGATHCPSASAGHQGSSGPRGDTGPNGENGRLGEICLKLSFDSAKYCF